MRPLRYSINVTLDGCCDHRAMLVALAELGLIDEYEFMVQPRLAGHGPTLFAGLSKHIDLRLVSRLEFSSGAVAMRYEPKRT
jgi:dihydrofolate reductase